MKKILEEEEQVSIRAPKTGQGLFPIRFTAPYVSNAFSEDARAQIREKQAKGGSTTKKKTVREAKNFDRAFEQSMHVSMDGWRGIPSQAFKAAIVRACVLAGFEMTRAKMAINIIPDGFDSNDGMGLVMIRKGEPIKIEHAIPNANGSPDIRVRAMWRECEVDLKILWDADQFTQDDIGNLIMRAGLQVGVGAGRPFSQKSSGCGWGTFSFRG
jgi:hypothetical protein